MFKWLTGRAGGLPDPLEVLAPNLKVELEVPEGDYRGDYVTRVEESSEDRLLLAAPDDDGVTIPFREGTILSIIFSDAHGSYCFKTTVRERLRQPRAAFVVDPPVRGRIQRILHREYPRYDIHLGLEFQVVDSPEIYYPDQRHRTETVNLSGGGVCFRWRERVAPGSRLRLEIALPDDDPPARAEGEVLRCVAEGGARGHSHRLGVHFVNLDGAERQRIINYIHSIRRTATGSARD